MSAYLVPRAKPNCLGRLIIDYSPVNQLIQSPSAVIPEIEATLQFLQGKALFTSLDLRYAYLGLRIDEEIFNEYVESVDIGRTTPNTTVFLNVGKWEYRKGHDFILEAFNKAFEPEADVLLVMHCYNVRTFKQWPSKFCS